MAGGDTVGPSRGVAAGVPYVAVPPAGGCSPAPLIVTWHLMDPPRTEVAMAAALPLADVPAWRVHLGLPLHGSRTPAGGPEEFFRLAMDDVVLNVFDPAVGQAAAEFPEALAVLRSGLPVDDGPIGLVGGSAGAAVAQLVLAESTIPVGAVALVSPLVRLAEVIAANERRFGMGYAWSERSRAVAERLDFVARVEEIAKRDPRPAVLLVTGAEDEPEVREPAAELARALRARAEDGPDRVRHVSVPGMAHALAAEPGIGPAPRTAHAGVVDAEVSAWFRRHLTG